MVGKKPQVQYLHFFIIFTLVAIEIGSSFNSVLLPHIKSHFKISDQLAQNSIALFMFAFGISALAYGGLSDHFGRRKIILVGFGIFTVSSIMAALAGSVEMFLIARVGQGIGAAVGWIVGNASLKDVFNGKDYIRMINVVHAAVGVAPALMPVLGSYVAECLNWHWSLDLVALVALIFFVILFISFPETNTQPQSLTLKTYFSTYADLFKNKKYLGFLAIKVLNVALMFAEAANLPLIYIEHLGVRAAHYGWYVMPSCFLYVLSSYMSGRLVKKYEVTSIIRLGILLIILSNLIVIIWSSMTPMSAIEIQCIKSLAYIGWGMIFGNATASIVEAASKFPSISTSLLISFEMIGSAVGIAVASLFFDGTVVPLAIMAFCCATLSLGVVSFKFLRK